jgi:hypothetical protein
MHLASPIMASDKRPLSIIRPVKVVFALNFQELRQALSQSFGLAHENIRDGSPLYRSIARESKSGRLADQVVRIANIGRVEELTHRNVNTGAFFNGLEREVGR